MRFIVATAVLFTVLFATGCKTSCRQLTEKMCDCTNSSFERTSCLQQAANKESNASVPVTAEDEATCEALLDECDCRLIDTPSGKQRCGFAVSPDAGP